MRNLVELTSLSKDEIFKIFDTARQIEKGKYQKALNGKTIVLFFPESSIRTRVTFEKGIHLLGGQSIFFPSSTLDKSEDIKDVCGYLSNWVDAVIVRHQNHALISQMASAGNMPIINGMSSHCHPCEILSDLYALSNLRPDYLSLNYLFVGPRCNIARSWADAASILGFSFAQSCPFEYALSGVSSTPTLVTAVLGKDILLTDSLPPDIADDFKCYQVTIDLMLKANPGALVNPCPPFFRGHEISAELIDSDFFVGYGFKASLTYVQQAIILHCMNLL